MVALNQTGPIHKDFQVRTEEIIKRGLPIEERKLLVKKFSPPSLLFRGPATVEHPAQSRFTRCRFQPHKRNTGKDHGLYRRLNATVLQISKSSLSLKHLVVLRGCWPICNTRKQSSGEYSCWKTLTRRSLKRRRIGFGRWDHENGEIPRLTDQDSEPKATQNSNVSKNFKGPPRHQQASNGTASSGQRRNSYNSKYQLITKPWIQNRNQSGNQTTVKKTVISPGAYQGCPAGRLRFFLQEEEDNLRKNRFKLGPGLWNSLHYDSLSDVSSTWIAFRTVGGWKKCNFGTINQISQEVTRAQPTKNQFISNIFLIPKPDASSRLILNLKRLNQFIKCEHFKLEDSPKTYVKKLLNGNSRSQRRVSPNPDQRST